MSEYTGDTKLNRITLRDFVEDNTSVRYWCHRKGEEMSEATVFSVHALYILPRPLSPDGRHRNSLSGAADQEDRAKGTRDW